MKRYVSSNKYLRALAASERREWCEDVVLTIAALALVAAMFILGST